MSLTLKHNGATVDLAASRCELGSLVRSFAAPDSLTLRRAIAFDEPTDWQNEDSVQLLRDGAVVFDGRIKSSERRASPDGESILYTCLGLRDQADALPYQRTLDGMATARVLYNCPLEEESEEAGYVALDGRSAVGEILADILDSMAPELAGIVGDGSPGSGYVASELDALAVVPPEIVLAGSSIDEAIRTVLAHAPDFGYWIDPAARKARFTDLRTLAARGIAGVGDRVLRHALDFTTAGCYSACTVQGSHELIDILEILTPAWEPDLEEDWTSELAAKYPETYGTVWRLFATSEPAQQGGVIVPDRFVGSGDILVAVTHEQLSGPEASFSSATVVADTKLLLDDFAREWNSGPGGYRAADVAARFAYRKGRVAGRYPASGHAGTAHARRGLTRELVLIQEERGKKSIKGSVAEVLSPTSFAVLYSLALDGELADMPIEFNGDGIGHTLAANGAATLTLDEAPQNPVEVGDSFVITAQDDTAKTFEDGTLSALEKCAKETLEHVMDERVVGAVPLAGLDWAIALGQRINFTGTNDPEYASLGAPLVAVEHNLAHERTILTLTSGRAPGSTWDELERRRRLEAQADELDRQIRRMRRRHRRRFRAREGARGDPNELDPNGPYTGDGTWIGISYDNEVYHDGPGPVDQTLGGTGQYIQWIALDARHHVVEAGVGTFS
jgi:hypothetical protein